MITISQLCFARGRVVQLLLEQRGREKYQRTVGRPEKSKSMNDNDFTEPKHNTQAAIAEERLVVNE
jgi:hypothetical protein